MKKKKKKTHQYDGRVNSTLLSNGDHKKWHTKKKSKLLFKNVVDTERWKEIFKVCGSDSLFPLPTLPLFGNLPPPNRPFPPTNRSQLSCNWTRM